MKTTYRLKIGTDHENFYVNINNLDLFIKQDINITHFYTSSDIRTDSAHYDTLTEAFERAKSIRKNVVLHDGVSVFIEIEMSRLFGLWKTRECRYSV